MYLLSLMKLLLWLYESQWLPCVIHFLGLSCQLVLTVEANHRCSENHCKVLSFLISVSLSQK